MRDVKHQPHEPIHSTGRTLFTGVQFWAVPLVVVLLVMSALAALYLGGTINASENIENFPVAIVNQDEGTTLPDGSHTNVGAQITGGIQSGIDHDEFAVFQLSLAQAEQRMGDGDLYGAIVIPSGLSSDLVSLAKSATSTGSSAKPVITILTNPRAGTGTTGIVTVLGQSATNKVVPQVGADLVKQTQTQLAAAAHPGALSGAAETTLATPIQVSTQAYHPLPDGTGGGLSAFYFALLIILAGFTGSMIVSTFVDQSLGFVPAEFGPVYKLARHSGLSRLATLTAKWLVMAGVSISVAGLYIGIGSSMGMPIDHGLQLWAFSALATFGIAAVAQTIGAIFGGLGLLVNLFVFVVLALPSAGGTIPPEATPPLFRWLGDFEPMHQIYLGTRSILYFDGTWSSGLGVAVTFSIVAAVLGLVVGIITMRLYDRRGPFRGYDSSEAHPTTGEGEQSMSLDTP